MEYAIYDALRAGFDKLVLIIKREMYTDFAELFGDRIEKRTGLKIHYHLLSCSNYPHAVSLAIFQIKRRKNRSRQKLRKRFQMKPR